MEQKLDLRVIKTQNNIKNTFIQLLHQKDFQHITVQSILDKSLINRSTFYKYYTDKYDLAESIIQDILKEYSFFLDERFSGKEKDDLLQIIKNVYDKSYEEKEILSALWTINTDSIHLYDDMQQLLMDKYKFYMAKPAPANKDLFNYKACIYASVVMTTLKYIFDKDDPNMSQKIIENFNFSALW